MIPRKQRAEHEDWVKAYAQIDEVVTKQEIDNLVDRTVENIKSTVEGKMAAYGWSGGKDSIALGYVSEAAGIQNCVLALSQLEFRKFEEWIRKFAPPGLEIMRTEHDMRWLSENQGMLFPQKANVLGKWYKIVQHTVQERYFRKHKLSFILLGRRKADGNFSGENNIYTNKRGIRRYSPIADWSHEQVLALVKHYNLPLPPIYEWPRGWRVGTGPWPARPGTKNHEQGWLETCQVQPELVIEAADYGITSAQKYINKNTVPRRNET